MPINRPALERDPSFSLFLVGFHCEMLALTITAAANVTYTRAVASTKLLPDSSPEMSNSKGL